MNCKPTAVWKQLTVRIPAKVHRVAEERRSAVLVEDLLRGYLVGPVSKKVVRT